MELLPVLFRGHAHVFLEYLDEIALRAETEQAADRGGSVLGVLEQVLGSFYFLMAMYSLMLRCTSA